MLKTLRARYDHLSKKYYLPGFGIALILISGPLFLGGYTLLRVLGTEGRPAPPVVTVSGGAGTTATYQADEKQATDAPTVNGSAGQGTSVAYQAQETSGAPGPCPAVGSYTASAGKVKRGRAVTLSWDVPGARDVDIYAVSMPVTRKAGRFVLRGGPARGELKVYPTDRRTAYSLVINPVCVTASDDRTYVLNVETE